MPRWPVVPGANGELFLCLTGMNQKEIDVQVLILDQSTADRAALADNLRRAGFTSLAVASLKAARQALAQRRFDLLLLDLNFSDGSGLQFCSEIREQLGDGLVVIFVASRSRRSHHSVAMEIGADDCVDKPWNAEELLARIEARMRRRSCPTSPICRRDTSVPS